MLFNQTFTIYLIATNILLCNFHCNAMRKQIRQPRAEHPGYYKRIEGPGTISARPYFERMYIISPVLGATVENNINKLKEALEKGNDPNITNDEGQTALHWLTLDVPPPDNQEEIIKLLLQYGANPLKKSTGGLYPNENALEAAQRLKRTDLINLFNSYISQKTKIA